MFGRTTRVGVRLVGIGACVLACARAKSGQQSVGPARGGAHGQAALQAVPSADYRSLTHDWNDVANFNVETRRGVAIHGANEEIWAINTHASTLNRYDPLVAAPTDRFPTVVNPVSLVLRGDDVLVLGAGTRALACHDRTTGRIESLLHLPSEPFDLVVDDDVNRAYVSCMGAHVVVAIDLATMEIAETFEDLPGRRAAFLYLDRGSPADPLDNELFVEPQLSGNNSLVVGKPAAATIVDGEDPALFPAGGLPDLDLVSFDTATGARTDWGTDQGTILFSHARNPVTGAHWILNIESLNKDPAMQTEPDLKGRFAKNRISITDFAGAGTLPAAPDQVVSLDVVWPGPPTEPQPVSSPTDLTFDPASGGAWIVSPTNDVVAFVDAAGVRQPANDVQLPAGSIPRSFTLDPLGTSGLVYGWGTNTIYVISLTPPNANQIVFQYDFGLDLLPPFLQAGREHFYDAHNSQNGRTTCGTCHPGGGADGLGWSIPDSPIDEKGVMVTQSLIGIEDTFPHHWRGERDLVDFNAAFPGLLGGALLDEAPGGDLDEFVAFVQSLTSHANVNQSVTRRLDDARTPELLDGKPGSAIAGQVVFHEAPAESATTSCVHCHVLPTGSSGDVFDVTQSAEIPAQVMAETIQFDNILPIKDQPQISVVTDTGTMLTQELGFGWSHNGTIPGLFSFNKAFGLLTKQQRRDVTAFFRQFDTGTSPGAQFGVHLGGADPGDAIQKTPSILLPQAAKGWIDVIAFGADALDGPLVESSWLYDPVVGVFESDDPARVPQDWTSFAAAAQSGALDVVVLGVPPGNGHRLALDWDDDGLVNGAEAGHGCDPYAPDADGDDYRDGYEVAHGSDPLDPASLPNDTTPPSITSLELDFVNARVAKFRWTTDEPATALLTYGLASQPLYALQSREPTTRHTSVLAFDESSALTPNTFVVAARLTDMSGNQVSLPFASFDAGPMLLPLVPRILRAHDPSFVQAARLPGGVLDARVEVFARWKESSPPYAPAEDVVVIAQVLVEDVANERFTIAAPTTSLPTSFVVDPNGVEVYDALPGPFLVLPPTDTGGRTEGDFQLAGLSSGQRVKFNVIAIEPAGAGYDPANPVFEEPTLADYQMPTTQPADRCIELVY